MNGMIVMAGNTGFTDGNIGIDRAKVAFSIFGLIVFLG
jgi:hypothetical protein